MNAKVRNLLIGGILVVILGVAVLVLVLTGNGTSEESETLSNSDSSLSSVAETVSLWSYDINDIESATFYNQNGEYTIDRIGVDLFDIEDLAGASLDQSLFTTVMRLYSSVTATRLIEENPEDLKKYGLEEPFASVNVRFSDGTSHVLYVGDLLMGSEGYYCRLDDSDTVYMIDVDYLLGLNQTKYDYIELTILETWTAPVVEEDEEPQTEPLITFLEVTGGTMGEKIGDKVFRAEKTELSQAAFISGLSTTEYTVISPVEAAMKIINETDVSEENAGSKMFSQLYGLEAYSAVMYRPTEEQLAEYGLDTPYATVYFDRDGKEYRWNIGNKTTTASETAAYYFMVDGGDTVYLVLEENLPWVTVELNNIITTIIISPSINDVDYVDIDFGDETYRMQNTHDEEGKISGGSVNGEAIDNLSNYTNLYISVMSTVVEDINYDGDSDEVLLTITYHYLDESQEDTVVELLSLSERRCILSFDGNKSFVTKSSFIETLRSNIQKVLNGEAPNNSW